MQVLDIGIPTGGPAEPDVGLIADALLATIPRRDGHSNKFTSGHVVVLGGSTGLTGAPSLTALAAQRAGAGYVTVCVPASLATIFETRLLEAMTISLPDSDGAHTADGAAPVLAAIERGGALVIGPGLGRTAGAAALAQTLIAKASVPVVLDADGLNAFAGQLGLLATSRAGATVLTPHEGELARLLGQTITEVAAERLRSVRAAARESGAVVVLKGSDTLVAEPGGLVAVSRSAPPALATAGTGDVLAGVVGALLAKGLEPFPAAATAVRVHALAGERAAAAHGAEGVIASDVIDQLAAVISL